MQVITDNLDGTYTVHGEIYHHVGPDHGGLNVAFPEHRDDVILKEGDPHAFARPATPTRYYKRITNPANGEVALLAETEADALLLLSKFRHRATHCKE